MTCPFCSAPTSLGLVYEGPLVVGMWDAFPVNPGHVLLVTRRHVADWFGATSQERAELAEATVSARAVVAARYPADGFNVGINAGPAAGQTVHHLHVHVIPRVHGDVLDPRGGVRSVIPSRANYLKKDGT